MLRSWIINFDFKKIHYELLKRIRPDIFYLWAFFPGVSHRTSDTWIPLFWIKWIWAKAHVYKVLISNREKNSVNATKMWCKVSFSDQYVYGVFSKLPYWWVTSTFSPTMPSPPCAPGDPLSPFCPGIPGTLVWQTLQAFCQDRWSKSGGTEKISSSWTAAQHYCPLLCHIPWVEDKTPTDTKCSLNVCRAEIMWIHQQCLQECLSSRWMVNFVKLIDCDI